MERFLSVRGRMSKKNHNAQQMKFSIKDFLSKCDQISKMKFSIKDFFSKCEQIRKKLRMWSNLLKKSLMENFIFCAVICPLSYIMNIRHSQNIFFKEYVIIYVYIYSKTHFYVYDLRRLNKTVTPMGINK